MSTRLTFPAPRRCAVVVGSHTLPKKKGEKGAPKTEATWENREWTLEDVTNAKLAGAVFVRGRHDFASDEAQAAALGRGAQGASPSITNWLKRLPRAQLDLLKEILMKEAS